jgi:hypothetical protein
LVFCATGRIKIKAGTAATIQAIAINRGMPFARQFIKSLRQLLKTEKVQVILAKFRYAPGSPNFAQNNILSRS